MVTYKIEPAAERFSSQWVVIAMFGNSLSWEVGRYRERERAAERIRRIEAIAEADSLTH
jgi:hypothetical protein